MMMANSTGNTTKADRLEVLGDIATGKKEKKNKKNGNERDFSISESYVFNVNVKI